MTAPPMAYFGGKTRLAARIAALLPPHRHYIDPFAGSLAVLLAKSPSRLETVSDLDGQLMVFWRVLRDRPHELARVCALTPHSRAEYEAASDGSLDCADDLEVARRVWVQLSQGRAGTLRKTGWRFYVDPAGTSKSMPGYLEAYVDRMAAAAERLHKVSLECRPALEVIGAYGEFEANCLYVDPPYLGATRTSGGYRVEMSTVDEHAELLEILLAARAAVVLSGYPNTLYDAALAGWSRITIPASTGQGGVGQGRTEVIWSNRPISDLCLFDLEAVW